MKEMAKSENMKGRAEQYAQDAAGGFIDIAPDMKQAMDRFVGQRPVTGCRKSDDDKAIARIWPIRQ